MKFYIYLLFFIFLTLADRHLCINNSNFRDDVYSMINNKAKCFWVLIGETIKFYNLHKISNKLADFTFYDKFSRNLIYYNFCQNTYFKCDNKESLLTVRNMNGYCDSLEINAETQKEWIYDNEENVLTVSMKTNKHCFENYNFVLEYILNCDYNITDDLNLINIDDNFFDFNEKSQSQECFKRMYFKSQYACPRNIYSLWSYSSNNAFFIGCFTITAGFFLLIYGNRLITISTYIYSLYIVVPTSYYINNFISPVFSDLYMWILSICVVLLALVFGYFLNKTEKIKLFFQSICMSFCCSEMLYYVSFSRILSYPLLIYFMVIINGSLIPALIIVFTLSNRKINIASDSVVGAFFVIRVYNS